MLRKFFQWLPLGKNMKVGEGWYTLKSLDNRLLLDNEVMKRKDAGYFFSRTGGFITQADSHSDSGHIFCTNLYISLPATFRSGASGQCTLALSHFQQNPRARQSWLSPRLLRVQGPDGVEAAATKQRNGIRRPAL